MKKFKIIRNLNFENCFYKYHLNSFDGFDCQKISQTKNFSSEKNNRSFFRF